MRRVARAITVTLVIVLGLLVVVAGSYLIHR
jgi:hypothetical protein